LLLFDSHCIVIFTPPLLRERGGGGVGVGVQDCGQTKNRGVENFWGLSMIIGEGVSDKES
jgi:hypothetical protein